MIVNQLESIVMDELHQLLGSLKAQATDPKEAEALAAMAVDAAMLPVRIARGEDVASLERSLSAEGQNRALKHRVAVQETVTAAWQRAVVRLVGGLLATAVAG